MLKPVPDSDPMGGMRPLLEQDDALTGYEPENYPDNCWVLHAAYRGADRVLWRDEVTSMGQSWEAWQRNPNWRVLQGRFRSPEAIAPSEGQPDRQSLARLVKVLARHSAEGLDTECYWAQAYVEDLVRPTVVAHEGALREGVAHYDICEDPHSGVSLKFPAQWWAKDQSWYVLTDWDMSATQVFGDQSLILDLLADDWLEAVRLP
ncbi:hypothetical protein [Streptomyces orinoci]|uniref:Uncharacterized protein n=1 Tax=Streptomyces orinoci TaxID=67339 RepID=A0ABV3JVA8_STRON|nr:hypothetical protein [Streptomyces orinoci]